MRSIDKNDIRQRLIQFEINFAPLKFKQIQIDPELDRVDAVADAIIEGRNNRNNDLVKTVAAEGADEFVEVEEDSAA